MQMYKKLIVFFIFLMLFGEAYGETLIGSTYRYVFVVLIIVLLCSYFKNQFNIHSYPFRL